VNVDVVPTHIEGFDEVLGGGVPKGHVVLLSGLPGTMKSSLAYAILHNGAVHDGLHGLYVSLEQAKKGLERQMAAMGFDLTAAGAKVHILDVGSLQKEMATATAPVWVDFLKRSIERKREVDGVDLLVLDSLEAFDVLARWTDRRTELFRFFEWLRDLGATSFVLTESPPEPSPLAWLHPRERQDEGFLADGIVHLKMHEISDLDIQRRLRVIKMRSANHKTGYYALVFEDGRFGVTRAMSE
jgi:KaiC/GvpD/RAD55 family RecA-like ATPase